MLPPQPLPLMFRVTNKCAYFFFHFMCIFRTNKTHSAHPCNDDDNTSSQSCQPPHPLPFRMTEGKPWLPSSLPRSKRETEGFPVHLNPSHLRSSDGGVTTFRPPLPLMFRVTEGKPWPSPPLPHSKRDGGFSCLSTTSQPPSHSHYGGESLPTTLVRDTRWPMGTSRPPLLLTF